MPEVTAQVPNFRVTYERGSNSIANFTLRGVRGAALASRLNESSVAVYSDEVFMGDETAINGTLFDVERIEVRSEENKSELQSLMRTSYAVFCLNKNNNNTTH